MDLNNTVIPTSRLLLVTIKEEHAEAIFEEFNERITTYMHPRPAKAIEETLTFILYSIESMQKGENLQLVILNKENEAFLGCAGLHKTHTPTPELGIWVKESAHGNGFGKEAIHALKDWADEHLQYDFLLYPVDKANVPSKKIPESLGGVVDRTYEAMSLNESVLNILEYRIYP